MWFYLCEATCVYGLEIVEIQTILAAALCNKTSSRIAVRNECMKTINLE